MLNQLVGVRVLASPV